MSKLGSNTPAEKWRSSFGLGCLSGIVLTTLALALLGIAIRRGPESFPMPLRSFYGAAGTVVTAGGGSLSLEQIRAIRGVQPTVQVTLTEADINSYLQENSDAVGLPKGFKNPRVKFENGRVQLLVSTKVLLFSTRIKISMEPTVEHDQLKLAVKSIEAGGVDLPGDLRQIAETRVADLLADRLGEAGLQPESVTVGDGKLTVAARLVPVDAPLQEPEFKADEAPVEETPADEENAPTKEKGARSDTSAGAPAGRDWWPGN